VRRYSPELGHNCRSQIATHSANGVASHPREIVLIKRNTSPSAHVHCRQKPHNGDADRSIPRQRDRARYPARALHPGRRQSQPRAMPTPMTRGPTTRNPQSTPLGSAESKTSTPQSRRTGRRRPWRRPNHPDLQQHSASRPCMRRGADFVCRFSALMASRDCHTCAFGLVSGRLTAGLSHDPLHFLRWLGRTPSASRVFR
jgi:hypothetical protein